MHRFRSTQGKLGETIRRHPAVFGLPFLLIIVGASFGLSTFTQVRYDVADGKKKQVSWMRVRVLGSAGADMRADDRRGDARAGAGDGARWMYGRNTL